MVFSIKSLTRNFSLHPIAICDAEWLWILRPDLPPHLLSIDCQQLASKVHPKRPRVEFSHLGCFLLTNGEQKHHKKLNFINQLISRLETTGRRITWLGWVGLANLTASWRVILTWFSNTPSQIIYNQLHYIVIHGYIWYILYMYMHIYIYGVQLYTIR